MHYKKILALLGASIIFSVCLSGCSPQTEMETLYGPAPMMADWTEEPSGEAEELPETVKTAGSSIENSEKVVEEQIIDTQPEVIETVEGSNTVETSVSSNNLTQNTEPSQGETVELTPLLYGPAPSYEEPIVALYGVEVGEREDVLNPIEDGDIEAPIVALYGVSVGDEDVIVNPPIDDGDIEAPIICLYGVPVEDRVIDPPSDDDGFEYSEPIRLLYGVTPKY